MGVEHKQIGGAEQSSSRVHALGLTITTDPVFG